MIALSECIKDHWHSVERDLLTLGFTADDIGGRLSICQLISIVLASQPGTSVHHFAGGWSREAELMANLSEQKAGLLDLQARYARDGVDPTVVRRQTEMDRLPPFMGQPLESAPVDEFTAKLKERQRIAREEAEGKK